MNENFLHFVSGSPCILKINGNNIGSIDNINTHEIDVVTKTKQIYLNYEAIVKDVPSIPYTAIINTEHTPTSDNPNVHIVPFNNNHYDIILSPFYYYHIVESKTLFSGNVGEFFVSITTDNTNTKVYIYSGMNMVFNTTLPAFSTVKASIQSNVILIQGIISDNQYYALAIDSRNMNIIYNNYASSIEETKQALNIFNSCNTLCHHAVVCNVDYSSHSHNQYYVFEREHQQYTFSEYLIPRAFFECLQVEDESSLKQLLNSNLSSATISQFREYFGNIREFHLNRHDSTRIKVNYSVLSNQWNNYTFHIDGGKIFEIEKIF